MGKSGKVDRDWVGVVVSSGPCPDSSRPPDVPLKLSAREQLARVPFSFSGLTLQALALTRACDGRGIARDRHEDLPIRRSRRQAFHLASKAKCASRARSQGWGKRRSRCSGRARCSERCLSSTRPLVRRTFSSARTLPALGHHERRLRRPSFFAQGSRVRGSLELRPNLVRASARDQREADLSDDQREILNSRAHAEHFRPLQVAPSRARRCPDRRGPRRVRRRRRRRSSSARAVLCERPPKRHPQRAPARGAKRFAPRAAPASASAPAGLSPSSIEMKPPVPSAMLQDLQALGLDAKVFPHREARTADPSRGDEAHDEVSWRQVRLLPSEGDFAAPTRRKENRRTGCGTSSRRSLSWQMVRPSSVTPATRAASSNSIDATRRP